MDNLKKILEYKERINQNVKEILDLINEPKQQNTKPKSELDYLILTSSSTDPIVKNKAEIKKRTTDIIHCISCIAPLWREDKSVNIRNFAYHLKSLFELCLCEQPPQLRKEALETALGYANSLVLPIHKNKKWKVLIKINLLLAKIKATIRSAPHT